tara:strand:+ start:838 stop:1164 length:327 start_codon:yes stop_codon:yes gene_type:complete
VNVNKITLIIELPVKIWRNIGINSNEKINEPMDPEIVFLGLIFDNLGPPINLPKKKPPKSLLIETKIGNIISFMNSGLLIFINIISNEKNDKYNKDRPFKKNLRTFLS